MNHFREVTPSFSKIHERVRKRYLDRLAERLKKMRQMLLLRDWPGLKHECHQLKESGQSYGLLTLAELAASVERAIPDSGATRLSALPEARQNAEQLIGAIELLLAESYSTFN